MNEINRSLPTIDIKTIRAGYFAQKIVIVDGQPGCGKTMFSPIVAALDRVELLTYVYEIEYICSLYYLGKIAEDAAVTMVRMLTDLQLYNTMMSRQLNFRPTDISSVFRDARPWRYIKRLFQKGDEAVPKKIQKERPILNFTTHNLLGISEPIFSALGDRVVLIEVVRHPLYMLKQQYLNMERILSNARHFTIYFQYRDKAVPFWARGWEEEFLSANNMDKAVYAIQKMTQLTEKNKEILAEKYTAQILTIPFESFVVNPWPYMEQIERMLQTRLTSLTRRVMKKQHVPRKMYAEGIGLRAYKLYGWELPRVNSDENKEFEIRRNFAIERASSQAIEILDKLCTEYEKKYYLNQRAMIHEDAKQA